MKACFIERNCFGIGTFKEPFLLYFSTVVFIGIIFGYIQLFKILFFFEVVCKNLIVVDFILLYSLCGINNTDFILQVIMITFDA